MAWLRGMGGGHRLPRYAAQVFDRCQRHPELIRLVGWGRLERGDEHMRSKPMTETELAKIDAIERAQQAGTVGAHFPAPILFELMMALIELRPTTADPADEQVHAARRQAVKDAVARLVAP